MARSTLILVSDDQSQMEKVRGYAQSQGLNCQVFSTSEWARGMNDPQFRRQVGGDVPSLSMGQSPIDQGAKILPFPGAGNASASTSAQAGSSKKVRTINELESIAIENAIHEYNGNLTEAAKALGIGRATLYRKVKQYAIDPSAARRKRAA